MISCWCKHNRETALLASSFMRSTVESYISHSLVQVSLTVAVINAFQRTNLVGEIVKSSRAGNDLNSNQLWEGRSCVIADIKIWRRWSTETKSWGTKSRLGVRRALARYRLCKGELARDDDGEWCVWSLGRPADLFTQMWRNRSKVMPKSSRPINNSCIPIYQVYYDQTNFFPASDMPACTCVQIIRTRSQNVVYRPTVTIHN